MEIKESLFDMGIVVIDENFWPDDAILMAPKEFVKYIVNYIRLTETGNYVGAVFWKRKIDNWLKKEENTKQICLIRNIGVADAKRKEETNSKRT